MESYTISHNLPTLFSSAKVYKRGSAVLTCLVDSSKSSIPFFREQRKPHIEIPSFDGLINQTPFQRDRSTTKSPLSDSATESPLSDGVLLEARDQTFLKLVVNSKIGPSQTLRPRPKTHSPEMFNTRRASKNGEKSLTVPPKSRFHSESRRL